MNILTTKDDNQLQLIELESTTILAHKEEGAAFGHLTLKPAGYDVTALAGSVGPAGEEFIGSWSEDGSTFTLKGDDLLQFRCQNQDDQAKIVKLCPRDQILPVTARWDGVMVLLERAKPAEAPKKGKDKPAAHGDVEKARLFALPLEKLETLAAERGVVWDPKASRETMVNRTAAAKK